MKMVQSLNRSVFSLTLLFLTFSPGCDWFKGTASESPSCPSHASEGSKQATSLDDGSPALIKMDVSSNGKVVPNTVVATVKSLDNYLENLEKTQPGIKSMIDMIPGAKKQLLHKYAEEKVVAEWAQREKVFSKPEYIKRRQEYIELIDQGLPIAFFEEDVAARVKVDDKSAEQYYNEHKATEPMFQNRAFLKNPAGVTARSVAFATEKEANEFLAKTKAPGADIGKLAKESKKSLVDHGVVGPQSFNVDHAIVTKLSSLSDVPSAFVVKGDKEYFVVDALKKQTAEYEPFAQVKDKVVEMMNRKEVNDALMKRLTDLIEQYHVWIDEDTVAPKGGMPEEGDEFMEEAAGAQHPASVPKVA